MSTLTVAFLREKFPEKLAARARAHVFVPVPGHQDARGECRPTCLCDVCWQPKKAHRAD